MELFNAIEKHYEVLMSTHAIDHYPRPGSTVPVTTLCDGRLV